MKKREITRPFLRYHGGKFILAPWIVSFFPEHKVYVEPFGGAASVLLCKKRSYAEIYNDLDSDIVNLFTVCQNNFSELEHLLKYTLFSREEFELAYKETQNNVERARRTIVRSFMGFGSASATGKKTGFRSNSNRSGTTPAHDWKNYLQVLPLLVKRIQGVVIENRDALKVMQAHDSFETLHYVDPQYVLNTRYLKEKTSCYKYEMNDSEHEFLIQNLLKLKGKVIISGYDNDLYSDLLPWRKIHKKTYADGAKERMETLWFSPNISEKIDLFS